MDFISLLIKGGLVLLLSWIGRLVHTIWWRPMKVGRYLKKQGINGLSYKLLVGNVREEFSLTYKAWSTPMNLSHNIVPRAVPFHHEMVKKYGKMSMSWYGTYPRVIITEPELIREVLSTKHDHFEKFKLNSHEKFILTGLPMLDGEKWAKHRRIVNPAFHQEKLKLMLPAFQTSCYELMKRWKESVSSTGSCELDVWHEFQHFTGDVISRTAFSSSYKEGMQIFQLLKELLRLVHRSTEQSYIPGFRFLPTKTNVRKHEVHKEVCSVMRGMILEREKEMKMGNVRNDLLGLLMESFVKDSQEGRSNALAMTIEDVIDECRMFYFAGHDTTAILLTWTLVVLSMHSDWQVLAKEEVMQVFGKNDPDYDGLNHLKIVTMILYEVLRLYPPGVFLHRTTCKTVKLGHTTLLPDVQVCIPITLVHHDPEIWGDDVDEFKPERFAEGISKATKNQVGFLPFGWGPRICIGQNFAMVEAKMALAMILKHFSFELSPSYAHAPHFMMTLQPQYGAQVILHKL